MVNLLRFSVDQALARRQAHQPARAVQVEFFHDAATMGADGVDAQVELAAFAAGMTFAQPAKTTPGTTQPPAKGEGKKKRHHKKHETKAETPKR